MTTHGAQIGSAVMFVQQLERSVSFYSDILELKAADSSPTAALLVSESGSQLILRAMGSNAAHALGSVGVQYLVWMLPGPEHVERCERLLKERSAYVETRTHDSYIAVEGRDPDGIVLMVVYPGPDGGLPDTLPSRIYGW
jgi:catechol-2,3-dioxygenase